MLLDQAGAKQWCLKNPGVVLQVCEYYNTDDHGMSWDGIRFRYWQDKRDHAELKRYGDYIGKQPWSVAPWSPIKLKRPVVGGV